MSNEKLLREALIRLLGYATSLESTTDTDGDHPAMKQARYALSLPAEVGGALENKGSSMITTIDLTESGVKKFNGWFADVAKPGTDLQAVLFEMLSILTERAVMGESLSYELHRQHTISGRPEIITIGPEDVETTEVDDDDGDDA